MKANRGIEGMLERQRSQFFGKYRGQVVDNVDPLGKGRLRIKVPQVLGDVTVWAVPCVPYAGEGVGLFAMPEVGAGIWVEFEAGDSSYPIWVGCFWSDGDIESADAHPHVKFFRTRRFTLRIDDESGVVLIENDAGASIELSSLGISIKGATLTLKAAGGRKVVLSAVGLVVNDGALEVT